MTNAEVARHPSVVTAVERSELEPDYALTKRQVSKIRNHKGNAPFFVRKAVRDLVGLHEVIVYEKLNNSKLHETFQNTRGYALNFVKITTPPEHNLAHDIPCDNSPEEVELPEQVPLRGEGEVDRYKP